jgi:hypothetical protein
VSSSSLGVFRSTLIFDVQRYIILSIASWVYISSEVDSLNYPARYPHYGSWAIAIATDIPITISYLISQPGGQLLFRVIRTCLLIVLPCVSFVSLNGDPEAQTLLGSRENNYGAFHSRTSNTYTPDDQESQSLWTLAKGLYVRFSLTVVPSAYSYSPTIYRNL